MRQANSLLRQGLFRVRMRQTIRSRIWQKWLVLQGARIGEGTRLPFSISMNWPSQVSIGRGCSLQNDIFMEYCTGVWKAGRHIVIGDRTFIGRYCEFNITESVCVGNHCLIASGCKLIDHDHGMETNLVMRDQKQLNSPIVLEDDVWLGANVVVLRGVTIGRGAVVGAGAIVTKSIPSMEIWGGVPAKRLGSRIFERDGNDDRTVQAVTAE